MDEEKSLEESPWKTVERDLSVVRDRLRFFYGGVPRDSFYELELRNYDLWGPFFFSIAFASFLSLFRGRAAEQTFSLVIIF